MPQDRQKKIAELELVMIQHRNGPAGVEAKLKRDLILREIDDEKHQETVDHTKKAVRYAGWAVIVSVVGILVGTFAPTVSRMLERSHELPATTPDRSGSSSPPDTTSTTAKPAALPPPIDTPIDALQGTDKVSMPVEPDTQQSGTTEPQKQ